MGLKEIRGEGSEAETNQQRTWVWSMTKTILMHPLLFHASLQADWSDAQLTRSLSRFTNQGDSSAVLNHLQNSFLFFQNSPFPPLSCKKKVIFFYNWHVWKFPCSSLPPLALSSISQHTGLGLLDMPPTREQGLLLNNCSVPYRQPYFTWFCFHCYE